jgi:aryl-alcohol dehydrogenase-like predicted oxidoreductase
MEKKPLGDSGLEVTSVGIGCMMFGLMCDQDQTTAIVDTALDAGINFFDTADIYGGPHGKSEALLGKALGSRRGDVIIGTKFGAGGGGAAEKGGSRDYVMQAVEKSLELLGTDYIDLYQHHFPDKDTPVEETLRALEDLVQQGKVRHIGCSNYTGAMLSEAAELSSGNKLHHYVTAQNRYSLLTRDIEKDLVPVAEQQNVGILPYFPLESGLLTGKYRKGQDLPEDSRFSKWGGGKSATACWIWPSAGWLVCPMSPVSSPVSPSLRRSCPTWRQPVGNRRRNSWPPSAVPARPVECGPARRDAIEHADPD